MMAFKVGDRVQMVRRNDGTGKGTVVKVVRLRGAALDTVTVQLDTGGVVVRRAGYWKAVS